MREKIDLWSSKVLGVVWVGAFGLFSIGCFLAALNWVIRLVEEMVR